MARQRVDFTEIHNPTCKFIADDGTEFHVKINMVSLTRTDQILPDGQYAYEVNCQLITNQLAPEGKIDITKLKKDV